ncbi:MAG TPA: RHS repeat-associated core domain-containing protein [Candidatus Solibacter sp.]|nr:RHS repeat-associated core domain-containing protein [Candidatus Solibacter sp.]
MLPAGGNPIYYAEDLLGSSRVITQNNGAVCYDADFDLYGGEHAYTNNCPSTNAYKFEGKERDTETGNDDFGARYYTSRFGRWLSADWSSVPVPVPYANLTNPQTLNLYAMVSDDPESFADLDGHFCEDAMEGAWSWSDREIQPEKSSVP